MIRGVYLAAALAAIVGCASPAVRKPAGEVFEPIDTQLTNVCMQKLDTVVHTAWTIGDRENPDLMRLTAQIINKQAGAVNFRCLPRPDGSDRSRCVFEVLERGNPGYWEIKLDVDGACRVLGAGIKLLAG